jgi:hypothetical protein
MVSLAPGHCGNLSTRDYPSRLLLSTLPAFNECSQRSPSKLIDKFSMFNKIYVKDILLALQGHTAEQTTWLAVA